MRKEGTRGRRDCHNQVTPARLIRATQGLAALLRNASFGFTSSSSGGVVEYHLYDGPPPSLLDWAMPQAVVMVYWLQPLI